MVKTGEMISIEQLTVLSDTHSIELHTVGYYCIAAKIDLNLKAISEKKL